MALTLPSGMAASIGYKAESSFGAYGTVDRFVPLVSESIQAQHGRIESAGIISGRRLMAAKQWRTGNVAIAGDVQHEITDNSIGLLLEHAFGTVNTTGTGEYTHVFWPALLTGKSLSVQVGRPNITGTIDPYTYTGCKIGSWSIAGDEGQVGTMGLSLVAKEESLTVGRETPSYGSDDTLLTFVQGLFTIGGAAPTRVKSFSLNVNNALNAARYTAGGSLILEPLEAGIREVTGQVTLDYQGTVEYARVRNGTAGTVVLGFDDGTNELKFTLNGARFDDATPNVAGRDVLEQTLSFKAFHDTGDSTAFSGTLINDDSTA